ncbi:MAG: alpha/beta fold hydrolase, partial [Actinomycetota bacterium]
FQEPGAAETEFERDVRTSIRRILYGLSGNVEEVPIPIVPESGRLLDVFEEPEVLPDWLSQKDLDVYTQEFERTGFAPALNWVRNFDRNWELMAPWAGTKVQVPAMYMAGELDHVVRFPGMMDVITNLEAFVPNLSRTVMLPGCGHWTQQERADEVNAAIMGFLRDL